MPEQFFSLDDAAERVQKSRRTISRWIDAGELTERLGMVRESELLAVEKRMRGRRGRPRKPPDPVAEPVSVVAEAIGSEEHALAAVTALRQAGILPDPEKRDKRVR